MTDKKYTLEELQLFRFAIEKKWDKLLEKIDLKRVSRTHSLNKKPTKDEILHKLNVQIRIETLLNALSTPIFVPNIIEKE